MGVRLFRVYLDGAKCTTIGPWKQVRDRCNLQYASPKDSLFPPILFILRREFSYLKLASARSDVSFSLESPEVHPIFILDLISTEFPV
jgi:hypothetical protein